MTYVHTDQLQSAQTQRKYGGQQHSKTRVDIIIQQRQRPNPEHQQDQEVRGPTGGAFRMGVFSCNDFALMRAVIVLMVSTDMTITTYHTNSMPLTTEGNYFIALANLSYIVWNTYHVGAIIITVANHSANFTRDCEFERSSKYKSKPYVLRPGTILLCFSISLDQQILTANASC
ncbi:hypothetical protein C1H46_001354 [Malus baccata]|uniref:Uncharacterized protein n=1 Tax=Malus baccata TaxID=106549 RepID=A0A540NPN6_MALBA|nr:hypothetical protein C1H46_001354 [Malus baccata]